MEEESISLEEFLRETLPPPLQSPPSPGISPRSLVSQNKSYDDGQKNNKNAHKRIQQFIVSPREDFKLKNKLQKEEEEYKCVQNPLRELYSTNIRVPSEGSENDLDNSGEGNKTTYSNQDIDLDRQRARTVLESQKPSNQNKKSSFTARMRIPVQKESIHEKNTKADSPRSVSPFSPSRFFLFSPSTNLMNPLSSSSFSSLSPNSINTSPQSSPPVTSPVVSPRSPQTGSYLVRSSSPSNSQENQRHQKKKFLDTEALSELVQKPLKVADTLLPPRRNLLMSHQPPNINTTNNHTSSTSNLVSNSNQQTRKKTLLRRHSETDLNIKFLENENSIYPFEVMKIFYKSFEKLKKQEPFPSRDILFNYTALRNKNSLGSHSKITLHQNHTDSKITDYSPLMELIFDGNDNRIVSSIIASGFKNRFDFIGRDLTLLFEIYDITHNVLDSLMDIEWKQHSEKGTMFRGMSEIIYFMTGYSQRSKEYLPFAVTPIVKSIIDSPIEFSIQTNERQEASFNQDQLAQLRNLCELFVNTLFSTHPYIPRYMKCLTKCLMICLGKHSQETKHRYTGAFFFLRFLIPAIIMPHLFGILNQEPDTKTQKGLVLISKIIQNMSNNTKFHEPTHAPINDIVLEYQHRLLSFFDLFLETPSNNEELFEYSDEEFQFCSGRLYLFVCLYFQSISENIKDQELLNKFRSKVLEIGPNIDILMN